MIDSMKQFVTLESKLEAFRILCNHNGIKGPHVTLKKGDADVIKILRYFLSSPDPVITEVVTLCCEISSVDLSVVAINELVEKKSELFQRLAAFICGRFPGTEFAKMVRVPERKKRRIHFPEILETDFLEGQKNVAPVLDLTCEGSVNVESVSKDGLKGEVAEKICSLCWTNDIGCVFIPCGHACTCIQCAAKLCISEEGRELDVGSEKAGCPLCRGAIEGVYRFYMGASQ